MTIGNYKELPEIDAIINVSQGWAHADKQNIRPTCSNDGEHTGNPLRAGPVAAVAEHSPIGPQAPRVNSFPQWCVSMWWV